MSTTEQDIIIVGGGISGAALAYGLSGKGRKVTVLDAPLPSGGGRVRAHQRPPPITEATAACWRGTRYTTAASARYPAARGA